MSWTCGPTGCPSETTNDSVNKNSTVAAASSRILHRLCERRTRRPFDKRSLVHSYHLDSTAYAVEHRQSGGEIKVRCWDESCCELDVRPGLHAAIAFQRKDHARAHCFPARAEVHHAERADRLTVDMSGGVSLQLDILADGAVRACVIVKRTEYALKNNVFALARRSLTDRRNTLAEWHPDESNHFRI